jgi:hypothetical protein
MNCLRATSLVYRLNNYKGDKTYRISCTGDAVVGDEVRFDPCNVRRLLAQADVFTVTNA